MLGNIGIQDSNYAPKFEEFVKTDNNIWLVMEYCNGGSLAELIRDFQLNHIGIPVQVIKSIFWQILDAFGTLLSRKLLQTDLAPGNIMLHYPPEELGDEAKADPAFPENPTVIRDVFLDKL